MIVCNTHLTGELLTTAAWIKNFVMHHPDYKQDSVVTERITYDLLTGSAGTTLKSHTIRDLRSCPSIQQNEMKIRM